MATFDDPQIQKIKGLLGYGDLTALARPYFDIATTFEVVVQNNVNDYGKDYIINTIFPAIDDCTTALKPNATGLAARMRLLSGCDGTQTNPKEMQQLIRLRMWWIKELSRQVKVAIAPDMNSGNCVHVY